MQSGSRISWKTIDHAYVCLVRMFNPISVVPQIHRICQDLVDRQVQQTRQFQTKNVRQRNAHRRLEFFSFSSASSASATSKLDNINSHSSNLSNGPGGASNTILFAYRNLVVPQYVTYTQGQAKAVYVENWEKFDCPIIPDAYGIVVAYACMLELVRAVQSSVEGNGMRGDGISGTQLRTPVQLRPVDSLTDNERQECMEVVNCTWSSVLVTFTLLYDVCYDDTTCELLLRGFQTYISLCGMLGMNVQRDAFVTCLCKMALPPQYNIHLLSKQQNNEQQQQQQSLLQKLTMRTSADSMSGNDFERQQVVIVGTPLPLINSSPATNQTAVMV